MMQDIWNDKLGTFEYTKPYCTLRGTPFMDPTDMLRSPFRALLATPQND